MQTINKETIIATIEKLINQEAENARKYCEVNPLDADRRRNLETHIRGAYIRVLNELLN